MYQCSQERLNEKITTFGKFGDTGKGGITRLSLSAEAIAARRELCSRCEKLGMEIRTDDMGNIYATLPGEEDLPAILSGSHMDSVVQGGNYDGILGVLSALECAETIVKEQIPHRHPFTVVVWTNEEGARFDPAMMSSGVIAGKFPRERMLAVKDTEGVTFGEVLEKSGFLGSIENRIHPGKDAAALVEMHIEQGPVLEAEGKDIGIVGGVVGMVNYEFRLRGQSDHAGTFPMKYRRDALLAAADLIRYLHDHLDTLDERLVYTTGRIVASPNVHTVIPDDVRFTLDARHQDPEVIRQVVEIIKSVPEELDKCQVTYEELWARHTVDFDLELVGLVEKNALDLGYSGYKMYSGAGHDAQYIADILPTTMIFVPSREGHSHCEKEYTPVESCIKGVNVLLNTILELDKK